MGLIDNTKIKAVINQIENRLSVLTSNKFTFSAVLGPSFEVITVTTDEHFQYQDQGVAGKNKSKGDSPYKFNKMPPPSAFSRYTSSNSNQFAIARSVFIEGLDAQKYKNTFQTDAKLRDLIGEVFLAVVTEELIEEFNSYTN